MGNSLCFHILTCLSTTATRRTKSSAAPEEKPEDIQNESTAIDNTEETVLASKEDDAVPNDTEENGDERRVKQKTEGKQCL